MTHHVHIHIPTYFVKFYSNKFTSLLFYKCETHLNLKEVTLYTLCTYKHLHARVFIQTVFVIDIGLKHQLRKKGYSGKAVKRQLSKVDN